MPVCLNRAVFNTSSVLTISKEWQRWCCVPFINFLIMVSSLDCCRERSPSLGQNRALHSCRLKMCCNTKIERCMGEGVSMLVRGRIVEPTNLIKIVHLLWRSQNDRISVRGHAACTCLNGFYANCLFECLFNSSWQPSKVVCMGLMQGVQLCMAHEVAVDWNWVEMCDQKNHEKTKTYQKSKGRSADTLQVDPAHDSAWCAAVHGSCCKLV